MADHEQTRVVTDDFEEEQPLFSYSYVLSNALIDDMATALSGERLRNPPAIICAVLLIAIISLAASPWASSHLWVLIFLIIIEVPLWTLASTSKWHAVQIHKLRTSGLDLALIPEDERHVDVALYEDRIAVRPRNGSIRAYPLSSIRKPKITGDHEMLVLTFSDRHYVPVPRRSLSAGRYNELIRSVAQRAGVKLDA